jgi:hypothetical protein
MKHCPACNFSFPDFHLVCDFDGTELVPDWQRLALIKFSPRQSFVRRWLTSAKTLTALAILGLFSTAAFIAFQQTTSRSTRTLLTTSVGTRGMETAPATSRESDSSSPSVAQSNTPPKAPIRARRSSSVRFFVRTRREKRKENPSLRTEVAHRSESVPAERQPKLVGMLKTTWRVLKRPFSF